MTAPVTHRSITLSFLPDPVLLRVVRLAASSLANDVAFTVAEIDDLTLAVDELTAALIDVATTTVEVTISAGDDSVTVRAHADGAGSLELNDLAALIIARTTDSHALGDDEHACGYTMTKRRRVQDV